MNTATLWDTTPAPSREESVQTALAMWPPRWRQWAWNRVRRRHGWPKQGPLTNRHRRVLLECLCGLKPAEE